MKNTPTVGSAYARLGYLEFDLSSFQNGAPPFPSNYALNLLVTSNNEGSIPTAPQSYTGDTPCHNGVNPCSPAAFTVEIWGLTNNSTPWSDATVTWNTAPGGPYMANSTIGNTFNNPAAPCNGNCAVYLATVLVSPNSPLTTVSFSSAALTQYMNDNAVAGNSGVTLMLRRTDTNPQANLVLATQYYPGSSGLCAPTGSCAPTFGPPGYFGAAGSQVQGPIGQYWGQPPTIATSTPTSIVSNGQLTATLGGNLTSTTGGATQYVQYSISGQNAWTSLNGGGSFGGTFSQTVTTLLGGTTYDVQAYAVDNNVPPDTVYGATLTFTTQAAAPTGLRATPGNATATIGFTPGATGGDAVTNYDYSLDGGSTWTALSPVQTTSPLTISGLNNGTAYSIMLRAENSLGAGMPSTAVNVTPSAPQAAPTVTAVSPSGGSTVGGAVVTITGTGFTGATAVAFGGINASAYTVNSDTQITATVPAQGAGVVDVGVTTPAGPSAVTGSDQYTYAVPSVTRAGLATTGGGVSANVTITGCGALNTIAFTSPPSGASATFPFGLVNFTASACNSGGAVTVQIQFSQPIPAGSQFYKCNASSCAVYAGATISGNTVTYTVTDGGAGDTDGTVNGFITDPAGPGIPPVAVPTLPRLAEAALALMLGLGAMLLLRRRQPIPC